MEQMEMNNMTIKRGVNENIKKDLWTNAKSRWNMEN